MAKVVEAVSRAARPSYSAEDRGARISASSNFGTRPWLCLRLGSVAFSLCDGANGGDVRASVAAAFWAIPGTRTHHTSVLAVRARRHRLEAAYVNLQVGAVEGLDQGQKSEVAGGNAGD